MKEEKEVNKRKNNKLGDTERERRNGAINTRLR